MNLLLFLKTTHILSILLLHTLLPSSSITTNACPESFWVGDGYCDPECNNEENTFDGGDCCEETCFDNEYDCGTNGYDCQDVDLVGKRNYYYTKTYSAFELTFYCDTNLMAGYTVAYAYTLKRDQDDLGRKSSYRNDEDVPMECQQQFDGATLPPYQTSQCDGGDSRQKNPFCYDRGHIIMANHMDGTSLTKTEASYVTNLVPQSSGFNQSGGSWKETEDIIECHRDFPDVEKLDIFGGLIYDDDDNDYFLESHRIPTPDLYYKVVVKYFKDVTKDPDVIAWIMQNKSTDKAHRLDKRFDGMDEDGNFAGDLINTRRLKRLVNDRLDRLPEKFTESAFDAGESWDRPKVCSKGFVDLNDEL